MTSVEYDEIYSLFYARVEAYDFLQYDEDTVDDFMTVWLHSAVYEPYVRKIFSSVKMDDESCTLSFELKYSIDDETDKYFVMTLLAYGLIYQWIQPKVHSITNIVQHFGASDNKWYSQASHLSELRNLLSDAEYKMRSMIRDRGYVNNEYLDGASASSSIRS